MSGYIVEMVYLTTREKASLPTHMRINSAERPSLALCEQIVTVCKSRLERRIGSVTAEEMQNIDKALKRSLGNTHHERRFYAGNDDNTVRGNEIRHGPGQSNGPHAAGRPVRLRA